MKVIGVLTMAGSMLEAARQNGGIICQIYDHYMFSRETVYHNFRIVPIRQLVKPLATLREIDLVVGQPYCGNFSILGRDKSNDKRGPPTKSINDINYYVDGVNMIKPRAFIMENLIKSLDFLPLEFYENRLPHYDIIIHTIDYYYYNVPQHRRRILVVGTHKKSGIKYNPSEWLNNKVPGKTVGEVIGDLPFERDIPELNHVHWLSQKFSKSNLKEWFDYFPKHFPKHVKRIGPDHVMYSGKIYSKADFSTGKHPGFREPVPIFSKLLHWDKPSITIAINNIFHPKTRMPLTVRERARLQTYPDSFIFKGSLSSQLNQTSKTVPVEVIRRLIEQLVKDGL